MKTFSNSWAKAKKRMDFLNEQSDAIKAMRLRLDKMIKKEGEAVGLTPKWQMRKY